jgi:hypothetical protein
MAGEREVKKMKDWIGVHELVTYSTIRINRGTRFFWPTPHRNQPSGGFR